MPALGRLGDVTRAVIAGIIMGGVPGAGGNRRLP
jgi:hypothetical protein